MRTVAGRDNDVTAIQLSKQNVVGYLIKQYIGISAQMVYIPVTV